jgi:MFS family permease
MTSVSAARCLSAGGTAFVGPRIAVLGFLVLTGAFGLNFAAGQFFVPLTESRGWGLGTLSVAAALNTAISGLAQPALGRLIDRVGTRPVIAMCLALMAAAYVLMAAAEAVWQWLLAYGLLAGVGFAGSSSLAVTVLISRWYVRDRARVLSRVFLGINAGQLTLVPLGGLLIDHAGYRAAYLILGLVVLAVVVPSVALRAVSAPGDLGQQPDGRPEPPAAPAPRATLADALHSRPFWLATLAFGINGWTLYFTLLHLPRYARDLGGSLAMGGTLLAIAALASSLSMLAVSRLVGRWGKRRLVIALFWLRAAVLAAAALAATSDQLLLVAAAFGAASFPVIPLVMGLISERYGSDVLGGVLGVVFVSHQVFAGLGVFAGGALRTATGSYDPALLAAAVLLIAGSGLLLALDDAEAPADVGSRAFSPKAGTHQPPSPQGAIA